MICLEFHAQHKLFSLFLNEPQCGKGGSGTWARRIVLTMHLFQKKNLQKSPILKHLLREVLSVLGKQAVLCSVEISGAGFGSPPRMVYQIDFFLLIFRTYGEKISKTEWEKGGTPCRESRYHNHPTSSILPSWYQLRDADSTYGISQNTPFLSSQLYAYPLLCLLKPIQIVHVAHVLSLAGLFSRTMWTLR